MITGREWIGTRTYVLDESGAVVACPDLTAWAEWFEARGETTRLWSTKFKAGPGHVSTVFLGLDHDRCGGPPVLWETMIFGGDLDGYQRRYTSHNDAAAGHLMAVGIAALAHRHALARARRAARMARKRRRGWA